MTNAAPTPPSALPIGPVPQNATPQNDPTLIEALAGIAAQILPGAENFSEIVATDETLPGEDPPTVLSDAGVEFTNSLALQKPPTEEFDQSGSEPLVDFATPLASDAPTNEIAPPAANAVVSKTTSDGLNKSPLIANQGAVQSGLLASTDGPKPKAMNVDDETAPPPTTAKTAASTDKSATLSTGEPTLIKLASGRGEPANTFGEAKSELALQARSGDTTIGRQQLGPGSTPSVPTNPQSPIVTNPAAVANQISVAISNAQGGQEIFLRLDPPELGQLKITMTLQERGLAAQVIADSPDVEAFLRRNSATIVTTLKEAGFSDISLDLSSSGDNSAANLNRDNGEENDANRRTIHELTVAVEMLDQGTIAQRTGISTGLDIRV